MNSELIPIPSQAISKAGLERLPAAIGRAGEAAAWRFGDSGEAERLFRREAERHSGMIPNTIGA
jgi:hypothetical protein